MDAQEPSLRVYLGSYLLLLVGVAATVAVAYLPHGDWSAPLTMAVASIKATLVVLIFMHVRYSPRLTWIVIASGIIWLALLISLVQCDYSTRDWMPTRSPAIETVESP